MFLNIFLAKYPTSSMVSSSHLISLWWRCPLPCLGFLWHTLSPMFWHLPHNSISISFYLCPFLKCWGGSYLWIILDLPLHSMHYLLQSSLHPWLQWTSLCCLFKNLYFQSTFLFQISGPKSHLLTRCMHVNVTYISNSRSIEWNLPDIILSLCFYCQWTGPSIQ